MAKPVPFHQAPPGLFKTVVHAGELPSYGFKTEYGDDEAYCLGSGEAWWGEVPQTKKSRREQLVIPLGFTSLELDIIIGKAKAWDDHVKANINLGP